MDLRLVARQTLPRTSVPELLCASPAVRHPSGKEVAPSNRDALTTVPTALCVSNTRVAGVRRHWRRMDALKLVMDAMSSGWQMNVVSADEGRLASATGAEWWACLARFYPKFWPCQFTACLSSLVTGVLFSCVPQVWNFVTLWKLSKKSNT